MFYENPPTPDLRFGDIIGSFLLSSCSNYKPIPQSFPDNFKIDMEYSPHVAVLTPCCTISKKNGGVLAVSPLKKINPSFYFSNSFFREDLTRINEKVSVEQAVGPEKWAAMSPDEQAKFYTPDPDYTLAHAFIYEQNELFADYPIKFKNQETNTNFYMADFRHILKIEYSPELSTNKLLQLSVQTRTTLRNKLSYYFGRTPQEDII